MKKTWMIAGTLLLALGWQAKAQAATVFIPTATDFMISVEPGTVTVPPLGEIPLPDIPFNFTLGLFKTADSTFTGERIAVDAFSGNTLVEQLVRFVIPLEPGFTGALTTDSGQIVNLDFGSTFVFAYTLDSVTWTGIDAIIAAGPVAGSVTFAITDLGANITVTNVQAVPLPAAFWLLFSALAGLFTWRRKTGVRTQFSLILAKTVF